MKVKTQSKKVNKAWLNDHVNDPYVKMAQKEGYRARAAYKLKEIDEALGLIRPGQVVVDLGEHDTARVEAVAVRRHVTSHGVHYGFEVHQADSTWTQCVAALEGGRTHVDLAPAWARQGAAPAAAPASARHDAAAGRVSAFAGASSP